MHTVCVCEQHQNAKLLVAAVPEQLDYKNCLSGLVCNLNEKNCMLHSCSQCPEMPQLQKALEKILDDNDFDVDDSIKCKQWIHTDGTKLIDMQLLVSLQICFWKSLIYCIDTTSLPRLNQHFFNKPRKHFLVILS